MKEIDIYTSKYFFILKNFQTTQFKIVFFVVIYQGIFGILLS